MLLFDGALAGRATDGWLEAEDSNEVDGVVANAFDCEVEELFEAGAIWG